MIPKKLAEFSKMIARVGGFNVDVEIGLTCKMYHAFEVRYKGKDEAAESLYLRSFKHNCIVIAFSYDTITDRTTILFHFKNTSTDEAQN